MEDHLHNRKEILPYVMAALVLVGVALVRIRLLDVPLERDEGEYAYMGQLLLKGFPPFTHAYTMKLPGTSILYALFMLVLGQSAAAIRIGLLCANILSIFFVYRIGRQLFDKDAALAASAVYGVLSISNGVLGVFAHATHFVVLFFLGGILLLPGDREETPLARSFGAGLCCGIAILMKQHAVLLLPVPLLRLLREKREGSARRTMVELLLFLAGAAVPYLLVAAWMLRAGAFGEFRFWTIDYAREYATGPTIREGLAQLLPQIINMVWLQPLLWLLSLAGCAILFSPRCRCRDRVFLLVLLLCSLLATVPGLAFRQHYFVMILPAAALLAGCAFQAAKGSVPASSRLRRILPQAVLVIAVAAGLFQERKLCFALTPVQVSRATYGSNPFPEAVQVGRYLKENSSSGDRIAVLGSEPEILFYADRLSATGFIYMYGLMENQPHALRMQTQMIREIEASRPKYVVVVNVDASWLLTSSSNQTVLDWGEKYVSRLYELIGFVDIVAPGRTSYVWGAQAREYQPVSGSYLTVFRRKE